MVSSSKTATLLAGFLVIAACGADKIDDLDVRFSFDPSALSVSACKVLQRGLQARLLVSGNFDPCELTIETANAGDDSFTYPASGSCSGITPGLSRTVTLEYYYEDDDGEDLIIARAEKTVDLTEPKSETIILSFSSSDFVTESTEAGVTTFDWDEDGCPNLNEACAGMLLYDDPERPDPCPE